MLETNEKIIDASVEAAKVAHGELPLFKMEAGAATVLGGFISFFVITVFKMSEGYHRLEPDKGTFIATAICMIAVFGFWKVKEREHLNLYMNKYEFFFAIEKQQISERDERSARAAIFEKHIKAEIQLK